MNSVGIPVGSHSSRGYHYVTNVSFSWEDYLSLDGSKPAPVCCFKQAEDPPVNEFVMSMKLESRDPRNPSSMCIATVIDKKGPRLKLRLDGSDNKNDFWCLVDSTDIRPYGWTKSQGDLLQPPLGFVKNASFWPTYLSKIITSDKMAPESCFKPEPPSPKMNCFEVGMKLEAVDRKNPHLICPATVNAVDSDKIHLCFDGWKGTLDYWVSFTSRDIFPVGWCAKAGHPLQPPGLRGMPQVKQEASARQGLEPDDSSDQDAGSSVRASISSTARVSASNTASGSSGPAGQEVRLNGGSSDTVIVNLLVNGNCYCGPYIDPALLKAQSDESFSGLLMDALCNVVQMLVNCAVDQAQVFNRLDPGNSVYVVTARPKDTGSPYDAVITDTCQLPTILSQLELEAYIRKLLSSLLCCPNLITTKSLTGLCRCRSSGGGGAASAGTPLIVVKKRPAGAGTPVLPCKRGRPRKVRPSLESSSTSLQNGGHGSPLPPLPASEPSLSQRHQMQLRAQAGQPAMPGTDPYAWSCDEVARYVEAMDSSLEPFVNLLKQQEIDGRAFMLLNSDIVMKYLNVKLGPALKLCDLIDRLKLLHW